MYTLYVLFYVTICPGLGLYVIVPIPQKTEAIRSDIFHIYVPSKW